MPFDPEKLKQAQAASKPTSAKQAQSAFSAEKLSQAYGRGPEYEQQFRNAAATTIKQSALPLTGQVIGTGLGLMTGPAAPFAVPALEASLGMAGEGLNQALGITEESPRQLLLQGAVPFGTRLLGAAAGPLRELSPPTTRGAEFLNRIAAPEARLRMAQFAAPESEALFNRAFNSGATFYAGGVLPTVKQELRNLRQGPSGNTLYGRTIGILEDLETALTKSGNMLDPRTYQAVLRDLGAAQRGAEGRTINQVEKGAIQSVYAKLAQALDREAIPGPGGGAAPRPGAPAIEPEVMADETSTALTVPRQQGPLDRGMQTGTPLQPNVPSTRVILPGMQPNQPAPFRPHVPGVRQADEIIPAPTAEARPGPDIRVSAVDDQPSMADASQGFSRNNRARDAMSAQDLIQARTYVKRQALLDEIEDSITKAETVTRGQGGNVQFNAAVVLRDLKKNPFWNGTKGEINPAFTAAEKRDIESIFTMLNDIPALKPGAGVAAGSYQLMKGVKSGMLTGGSAGALSGDPVIAGAATAAGAMIPTMMEFGRVLNVALRTQAGRDELKSILRQPNPTIPNITAKLLGVMTASRAEPGPGFHMPMTSVPTPFGLEQ
jgi:hypothetical protein